MAVLVEEERRGELAAEATDERDEDEDKDEDDDDDEFCVLGRDDDCEDEGFFPPEASSFSFS